MTDYPPLTEQQRKILKSREDRYIASGGRGDGLKDDFGHVHFDHNHPEVKASLERMMAAVGLKLVRRQ